MADKILMSTEGVAKFRQVANDSGRYENETMRVRKNCGEGSKCSQWFRYQ